MVLKKGENVNNMELTTLSDEKLKSMAYDEMVRIQVAQNNIQVINQELSKRQPKETKMEEKVPEDSDV